MSNNVHNDLFAAARLGAKSFNAVLDILSKTQWANKEHVDAIKVTYQLGFYAGLASRTGKPCTREQAEAVFKLKPAKDGGDDKHRTLDQHRNVRCAISAWSHMALRAGMPNTRTGKPRKAKPGVVPSTADTAPRTLKSVIVPKAKSQDDVRTFALELAALMIKFENANAKTSFGDYRMVFNSFRDQVGKLANPVDKVGSMVVVQRAA